MRFLALLIACAPASAQLALYDAGTAGNPAVPPDPTTQGWSPQAGAAATTPIANDGGLNAWELNDPDALGWCAYQVGDAFSGWPANQPGWTGGWELTATVKVTAGDASSSVFFELGSGATWGDNRWVITLGVSGTDVIAYHPTGSFVCAGGADGSYHTFTLRQDVGGSFFTQAEFLYEGTLLGLVHGTLPDLIYSGGVRWGCDNNFGTGRARFHRVELRFNGDLGTTHCNPAVPNSTGVAGAASAWGSPYVNQNRLEVTAADLPTNQFGYLLASLTAGFTANPGGSQGDLCLAGNIGRFTGQVQSSGAGGTFTIPVDLGAIPTTPVSAVTAGETWNFQFWYRDANPGPTSNFTNALRIPFE